MGIAAVGLLLGAAAAVANAQSAATATPGWLSGALYDPSSKIAPNLPAESGVNFTLSPFSGYVNVGSGNSGREFSGSSGSVAFPVGHSFGLLTNFTAASLGSNGLYDLNSNLYWRAPDTGLIGALGGVGEFTGSNGFHYALGGANAEGYFGRVTLFGVAGAFGLQGLSTYGFGTIGAAYYPTDNLQLSLGGYDFGGISGAQAGVEYLLPKPAGSPVAVTVGADGYVGNHGTSGLMARLRLLSGLNGPNNKTLIERRREDDPASGNLADGLVQGVAKGLLLKNGITFINPAACPAGTLLSGDSCSHNSQCCSGTCTHNECD